ncbi:hypothetical protein ZMO01_13590 [Zymomonas mobilis subsp. mobilis]|nr:hypothetical protein ZMO01_13590 [Zymomonas mobilis subsp. mobilis]
MANVWISSERIIAFPFPDQSGLIIPSETIFIGQNLLIKDNKIYPLLNKVTEKIESIITGEKAVLPWALKSSYKMY